MGEVLSYTKGAIDQFILSAEVVGPDLVLTKGSGETITVALGVGEGASFAYVDSSVADAVAALMGGATPEALNTLNELAAAFQDDANVVSTILAEVASLESQIEGFSSTLNLAPTVGGVLSAATFVASSNLQVNGAVAADVPTPAGTQDGDTIIVVVYNSANGTFATPSGWTKLGEGVGATRGLGAFTKVASGEGATLPFTNPGGVGNWHALTYRGGGAAAFVGVAAGFSGVPSGVVPTGTRVIGVTGTVSGSDLEPLAGWTERVDYLGAFSFGTLVVDDVTDASESLTPGASGDNQGAMTLTLAPGATNHTLQVTDAGKVVEMTANIAVNLTIPDDTVNIPVGSVILVRKTGASGTVTIAPAGGVTVNPTGVVLDRQWQTVILHKRGANSWHVQDWTLQSELDSIVAALSVIGKVTPTDNYTLILTDAGKVVEMDKATAINLTVPLNASVAFPIGTVIEIWQKGAGQVTIVPTGGVTIRSTESKLKLYGQYTSASLRKRDTNEWVLTGDLVA